MQSEHNVKPNILPRRIIVLNWHGEHESLTEALDEFSPPGTEVVFVGEVDRDLPSKAKNVKFRQVSTRCLGADECSGGYPLAFVDLSINRGHSQLLLGLVRRHLCTTPGCDRHRTSPDMLVQTQVISSSHVDFESLCDAGWKQVDAVVFGPDLGLSDSVFDAQLIADMMVLQQFYADAGCSKRLHFVAPARDPLSAPVVNHVLLDFGAAQKRLAKADPVTRTSNFSQALNQSIGDSATQAGARSLD